MVVILSEFAECDNSSTKWFSTSGEFPPPHNPGESVGAEVGVGPQFDRLIKY